MKQVHRLQRVPVAEKSPRGLGSPVWDVGVAVTLSLVFVGSLFQLSQAGEVALNLSTLLLPSSALLVLAGYTFLVRGGTTIDASSITSFGILLFCAFAGIYTGLGLNGLPVQPIVPSLHAAGAFFFLLQIVILLAPRPTSGAILVDETDLREVLSASPRVLLGSAFFVVALLASNAGAASLAAPLGLLGVFFIGDAALSRRTIGPLITLTMVTAVFAAGYATFIFSGFGRLVLGMLFIGLASILSVFWRRWWLKLGVLLLTPVALGILSASRLVFLQESRGVTPSAYEGIGSVVGPFVSFAQIINAAWDGLITPTWGSSFLATAVLWIPRSLWPGKPPGFGVEMVPITQPQLVGVLGYSDAATLGGEFVWNLGLLGAVIVIPLFVLALMRIDAFFAVSRFSSQTWPGVIDRLLVVIPSASLLHMIWGGTFSFAERTLFMIFVLVLFRFIVRPRGRERAIHAPKVQVPL